MKAHGYWSGRFYVMVIFSVLYLYSYKLAYSYLVGMYNKQSLLVSRTSLLTESQGVDRGVLVRATMKVCMGSQFDLICCLFPAALVK